jgi:hypothetical protein
MGRKSISVILVSILAMLMVSFVQEAIPAKGSPDRTSLLRSVCEETRYFTVWDTEHSRFKAFAYRQSGRVHRTYRTRDGRHNASWAIRIGYDLYNDVNDWGEFDIQPGDNSTYYKAIVTRTKNGKGIQHATYECPQCTGGWDPESEWEDLPPLQWNFRIGFYFRWDNEPWRQWNSSIGEPVMHSFRSENLYALGLSESVWDVYYWTALYYDATDSKTYACVAFGNSSHNSRIENFKFHSEHSRNTNFEYGNDSYWSETGNIEGNMRAEVLEAAKHDGKYGLCMYGLGGHDYIKWYQNCVDHRESWNLTAFMKVKRMAIKKSRASLLIHPKEDAGSPFSLECYRNESGKIIWAVFNYNESKYEGNIELGYANDHWYELKIVYNAEVSGSLTFYVDGNKITEVSGTRTINALAVMLEVAHKKAGNGECFFFDSSYPIFNEDD